MSLQEEYLELFATYATIQDWQPDHRSTHNRSGIDLANTKFMDSLASQEEKEKLKESIKEENELIAKYFSDNRTVFQITYELLKVYQEEVDKWFKFAGYSIDKEILFGQFPVGNFNAQAVQMPSGYLILVKIGLMVLLNKVVKLFMKEMFDSEGDPWLLLNDEESEAKTASTALLLGVVIDYLTYGDAILVPFVPASVPSIASTLRSYILVYIEEFIVAHEYAHIVNGDLNSNITVPLDTPVGKLDVIPKTWEKEFLADAVAVDVTLKEYKRLLSQEDEDGSGRELWDYMLTAPLTFFAIDELVTEVTAILVGKSGEEITGDHPPASMRSERIWERLSQQVTFKEGWSLYMPAWLEKKTRIIASLIRD
jgi:hypothetical protein